MNRHFHLLAIGCLLLASLTWSAPASADKSSGKDGPPPNPAVGKIIPGQYIVVQARRRCRRTAAATVAAPPTCMYDTVLNGFAAHLSDAEVAALRRTPAWPTSSRIRS